MLWSVFCVFSWQDHPVHRTVRAELVDIPFVFHDMQLQSYVQYIPLESVEDNSVFKQYDFLENGFPSVKRLQNRGYPAIIESLNNQSIK